MNTAFRTELCSRPIFSFDALPLLTKASQKAFQQSSFLKLHQRKYSSVRRGCVSGNNRVVDVTDQSYQGSGS